MAVRLDYLELDSRLKDTLITNLKEQIQVAEVKDSVRIEQISGLKREVTYLRIGIIGSLLLVILAVL